MNHITVTALAKKDKPWKKRLEVFGLKALKAAGCKKAAFDVYLVPDGTMRALNREFRGQDRPTNVLSFTSDRHFPHPELGKGVRYLGEIFLDPGYIAARDEDIRLLFIHSFLHLLGYTHGRRDGRIKMEKKEKWLISSLD